MKKNVLKKFAAAALAAATVMSSMSVMAFAADAGAGTEEKGSVTITKYMGNAANDYEDIKTNYGAAHEVSETEKLKNVKFAYIEVGTREQVEVNKDGTRTTEMLYTLEDTAAKELEVTADVTEATGAKYYRMSTLDKAIRDHKKEAIDLVKKTAENHETPTTDDGTVKFTELSLEKLYLFAETDASAAKKLDNTPVAVTKVSVPFFVSLPFTDASGKSVKNIYAYPKNSTGNEKIDKIINNVGDTEVNGIKANANIGDIITYKVTYSVPVPENGLADLQIVDTMSEGLTFTNDKDNIKVVDDEYQKTSTPKELAYGKEYDVTQDGKVVTINFKKYLNSLEKNSTEKFTITYKVKLNDKAVLGQDGNKNSVKLQYKNDINDKFKDVPGNDDTKVFTYGIDLLKKGEGKGTVLAGVTFTLTDESNTAVNVEKKESNTFYTPGGHSNEVETDAAGRIYIRGLKPGTYKLTETKTNAGYVLLKNPVEIKITPSSNAEEAAKGVVTAYVGTKEVTMTDDNGSATAKVPLTVVNSKGFDLPATGGRGIALFTIAGIAIVAAAGSLLFMRKRSK